MGAGDMIVVPETATISEAAALLCRGLEEREQRMSRASSQDVIAVLTGQPVGSTPASAQQDDDAGSSSTSSADTSTEAAAASSPTQIRWEDWFTQASFSHPHVMSRLERLMGTNVVRITDRKYMLELQRRIREDHIRAVRERIRAREVDELEREKKLILDGRMSLDEAPKELVDHPVFQISQFIKNVLLGGKVPDYLRAPRNHVQPASLRQMASNVSRSSSSRAALSTSRSHLASEDATDRGPTTPTTTLGAAASRPTSTSSSSRASSPRTSRKDSARSDARTEENEETTAVEDAESTGTGRVEHGDLELGQETERGVVVHVQEAEDEEGVGDEDEVLSGLSACDFEEDFDRQADVERGYMFTQEDYDRIKFEAESVKKMWELETVEELYALAESIVKEMVAQGGGVVAGTPTTPAPVPAAPAASTAPTARDRTPATSRRQSINPAPPEI